jgi:hypothetical protein
VLLETNGRCDVPWSNGDDTSLTKRKRGFDSLRDDSSERSADPWSVGVTDASLSCKEVDRVRFSGGPYCDRWPIGPRVRRRHASMVRRWTEFDSRADLWNPREAEGGWSYVQMNRAAGPTGRRRFRTPEIGVRLPGGPFFAPGRTPSRSHRIGPARRRSGSWPNGRAPPWRGGGPGSTPGGSIVVLAFVEGSRIRVCRTALLKRPPSGE